MEKNCKNCKKHFSCNYFVPFPERGCNEFVSVNRSKRFVLIHHYLDSGHMSIVAFSDSKMDLQELELDQPHFGSIRHDFFIIENFNDSVSLSYLKDRCLINICKNVADYLAVGEYAMLKKSYYKSAAWFEKAKNSASLGSVILENY